MRMPELGKMTDFSPWYIAAVYEPFISCISISLFYQLFFVQCTWFNSTYERWEMGLEPRWPYIISSDSWMQSLNIQWIVPRQQHEHVNLCCSQFLHGEKQIQCKNIYACSLQPQPLIYTNNFIRSTDNTTQVTTLNLTSLFFAAQKLTGTQV